MGTDGGDDLRIIPKDLAVVELDESKINDRVIQVVAELSDAIEGVLTKFGVTYEEYELFRKMTMELGPFMLGVWDPWISPMLERIHGGGRSGTSPNPEGPFYVPDAPQMEAPVDFVTRPDIPGDLLIVRGQVRAEDGSPLAGAEFDLWQCNAEGFYSNFGMHPDAQEWDFRGKFSTDGDGRFEFRTIKPPPYRMAGTPEIVEDFFAALGRSQYRPAHIHLGIAHPSLPERYITQLYFASDPYRDFDIGAAVREDLISQPVLHDAAAEIAAAGFAREFYTVDFDFVLSTKQPAEAS